MLNNLSELSGANKRKNHKLRQYIQKLEFNNHILQTQQEVSLDGILVVDDSWNMVSFNQRFIDMWQIPSHILESRDDRQSIQAILDNLKHPQKFMARVEELMAHPTKESRDELELKDGRYFDRYSAPIFDKKNNLKGRVWFFHDITELTQARQILQKQNLELEKRVYERTSELEKLNSTLLNQQGENDLQKRQLEARNIGLRTLLHSLEDEKKYLEEKVLSNFRNSLVPFLDMLGETALTERQQHIFDAAQHVLADLTSSMNHELQTLHHPLTPSEMKVANSIRAGKTSKEIAKLLCCSERTVEGHRQGIRRKLGLKKGENLLSRLLSFA